MSYRLLRFPIKLKIADTFGAVMLFSVKVPDIPAGNGFMFDCILTFHHLRFVRLVSCVSITTCRGGKNYVNAVI